MKYETVKKSTTPMTIAFAASLFVLNGCATVSIGDSAPDNTEEPANPPQGEEAITEVEQTVLDLINAHRAAGADCGSAGLFDPADPLANNDLLLTTARAHSDDMAARDYFAHINPEGKNPGDRIEAAGYAASAWAENIAFGQTSAEQVVDTWMNSPGHCANIMSPFLTEVGTGYNEENYWTQVFAAPWLQ